MNYPANIVLKHIQNLVKDDLKKFWEKVSCWFEKFDFNLTT